MLTGCLKGEVNKYHRGSEAHMVKTGLHGLNLRKITQRKTTFPCYIMCPLQKTITREKALRSSISITDRILHQFGGGETFTCSFFPFFCSKSRMCIHVKKLNTTLFCEVHIIGFKSTWNVSDGQLMDRSLPCRALWGFSLSHQLQR